MKKLKLILFFFLSGITLNAQVFREFNTGFQTIYINPAEVNSYYFGHNPALLDFTPDDELMVLSTNINLDDGKFKRFIEPVSNRLYQLTASGKKAIDNSQRFKGSFGFQRYERNDWAWIFTREYQNGNPFLIGDSTSGDSRINGIIMSAEYSNKLSEDISVGVAFEYSVDEMLKEVSPRPTSEHRDIYSRIGMNYSISKDFNLGVIADVYDKNEKISYREDEGSITQETIILKFKGYDFPNVFRKKTETRYSYINGYAGGITSSYILSDRISSVGYFIFGFDKTNIKDDAINPKAEGFWLNNYLDAGLQISASPNNQIQTGLIYKFHRDDSWAKYPPYNTLYYEKVFNSHSAAAGIQYAVNQQLSFGIEAGVNLNMNDERDFYSALKSKVNSNTYFGRLGLGTKWNNDISSIISYTFSNKTVPDYSTNFGDRSDYFTLYKIYDLAYIFTGFSKHDITLVSQIDPWFGGSFYTYLNYNNITPQSGSAFENQNKSEFNLTIEYRVKVF